MTIEQLVGNTTRGPLVGQLQRLGAEPLDADNRDNLIWQNASDCGGWQEVFEAGHVLRRHTLTWTREVVVIGSTSFGVLLQGEISRSIRSEIARSTNSDLVTFSWLAAL